MEAKPDSTTLPDLTFGPTGMVQHTRMDRNIVHNIMDLRKYGADEQIIKFVIFHIAQQQQNELFSATTFDPDQFCQKFGFQKANLFKKHPDSAHRKDLSKQGVLEKWEKENSEAGNGELEHRIFDTVLENALYRLMSENLVFHGSAKKYVDEDNNYNVEYPLKSISIISDLTARHITTKKGQRKIVYEYALNGDFKKNLTLFYTSVNLSVVSKLRQPNAENLYIFLKNLRDTLKSQNTSSTASIKFDKLCEIAGINSQSPKKAKQRLIHKFKTVTTANTDFPVDLRWTVQVGHRWPYTPVISFPDLAFDEKTRAKENRERITTRRHILLHTFMQEITDVIKELYPTRKPLSDDFVLDVLNFLNFPDNIVEKQNAFIRAQARSFIKPNPEYIKKSFLIVDKLRSVQSPEEILEVISGKGL